MTMNTTAGVPHTARIRVRYAETDKMGVVYYANYFVWFEVARAEWLRASGWTYREMEADGLALPVIEAHCDYKQPTRYDDDVAITATATLLTPARLRFDYEVRLAGAEGVQAVGHTVHAVLDSRGRPCRLPERIRQIWV